MNTIFFLSNEFTYVLVMTSTLNWHMRRTEKVRQLTAIKIQKSNIKKKGGETDEVNSQETKYMISLINEYIDVLHQKFFFAILYTHAYHTWQLYVFFDCFST